jgi:hypothetical protein
VNLDTARGERLVGCENVGPPAVAANAERQDMRMFEEEQRVADPPRAPVFDQRSLERERLRVRHPAEAADVERSSVFAYAPYLPHPPVLPI